MRTILKRIGTLGVTALLCLVALGEEVLTNDDVLKLVAAGLSSVTVETKIRMTPVQFDLSTAELVRLAKLGLPDSVIRVMLERSAAASSGSAETSRPPAPNPATPAPDLANAASPPRSGPGVSRRYDVSLLRPTGARCQGAELRIDSRGMKSTHCRDLDFDLRWSEIERVCHDYGFNGIIGIRIAGKTHRVMTTTPAEAKRIIDTIRLARPPLIISERCEE